MNEPRKKHTDHTPKRNTSEGMVPGCPGLVSGRANFKVEPLPLVAYVKLRHPIHGRKFFPCFFFVIFTHIFVEFLWGPLLLTGFPGPTLLRDSEAHHDPFSLSRDHNWGGKPSLPRGRGSTPMKNGR